MDFGADHVGFVLIAYAISAVVLIVLIAAIVFDLRRQQRIVAQLDREGDGARPRRRAKAETGTP